MRTEGPGVGEGREASLTPNLRPGGPHNFRLGLEAGVASQRVTVSRMLKQGFSPTQGVLGGKSEGTLRDQTSWQGSLCPLQLLRHLGHVSW